MNPWEMYGAPPEAPVEQPKMPWEMYAPEEPKEKNFFQRMGDNLDKRAGMMEEINQRTRSGQQNPIHGGLQAAGKVGMGMLNDLAGEALVSTGRGIGNVVEYVSPETAQFGREMTQTPIVQGTLGIASKIANKYGDFAKQHPIVAADLESATNMLSGVIPIGKGKTVGTALAEGGENAVKATGKAAVGAIDNVLTPKYAPLPATPANVRKAGGALFESVKKSGVVIDGAKTKGFIDNLAQEILPRGKWESAAALPDDMVDIMENLKGLSGQTMDIDDGIALYSRLGDIAHKPANFTIKGYSPTGAKLLALQDRLEDFMNNSLKDGSIKGGPKVAEQWKQAKDYWSASIRAKQMENIINNAQYTDHPATAIRVGARQIIKSKAFQTFPKAEQQAIKNAAKTGVVTDALRLGASGLGPVIAGAVGATAGTAIGGPVGGVVGSAMAAGPSFALREASKSMATARQVGRAQKAVDTMLSRGAGVPTKKLTMKQIMALPPEQARWYLNGNVK